MIKEFAFQNIRCNGCANTIKKALSEKFSFVEVDLSVEPRIVRVDIKDSSDEEFLIQKLKSLGYPLVGEDSNFVDKAKSFVSCAIGKVT